MSRFNLLDEPWIKVIDLKGQNQMLSVQELFKQASSLRSLSGDTRTQDYAILRVLWAILTTVFSRYRLDGESRNYPDTDWSDEKEDFENELYADWEELWAEKNFPNVLYDYLDEWHDRFYLFDEEYPFFQVTKEDIAVDKINRKKPSAFSGKNMNRLISESGNKTALFSPKYAAKKNKEILSADEIARWLITLQGYIGLSDKVIFGSDKYKSSKGWLFDIGGLYFEGDNLYETLLLNTILVHPKEEYRYNEQKPAWEKSPAENIKGYFNNFNPDNLAELYTIWARAIYIDPSTDLDKAFSCQLVKLPDLAHTNQFLEPMTLWRYNQTGENKGRYTPRKHRVNQSLWRSFGLVTLPDEAVENQRQPGIVEWLDQFSNLFNRQFLILHAISMGDDGNATSWVPTDEICDSLNIKGFTLIDTEDGHWVERINDTVNQTKRVVEYTFKNFLDDIRVIRSIRSNDFTNQNIQDLYYLIDLPFREWLYSLKIDDSKEEKIFIWYDELYERVRNQANKIVQQAGPRDYIGIVDEKDNRTKNIATAHNKFSHYLYKNLKEGRHE